MATNSSTADGSSSKPATSGFRAAPKVRIPASGGFGSTAASSGSATTPNTSAPSGGTGTTSGSAASSSTPATTNPKASSPFGVAKAPTSAFGASASASTTPQATPTTITPSPGGGFFSSALKPATPGAFGAPATSTTSAFGASSSTPTAQGSTATSAFGGSLFGAASKSPAPPTPGAFGAPAASTSSAFGSSTSTPSTQTASTTQPLFGGSLFGSTSKAPASSGAFGTPGAATSSAFGASTSATTTTPSFGGSLFGASSKASTTPSAFGASTASTSSGFGSFGSTPATPSAQAASTSSGFGASASTPTAQATSTTSTPYSGGAFSGFGSIPTSQTASKTPANTGGFGSLGQPTSSNTGSSFGSFGSQSQNPASLFTPFPPFGSVFGSGFASPSSNSFSNPLDGQLRMKQEFESLSNRLARELSLADERNNEVQSLRMQNQTLVRENDLLRRKFQSTAELTRSFEKNWNAVESLLNQSGVLPYTQLLTQVNRFNDAVSTTANFLSQSVVCRSPDAFQEELDRAAEDVQALMGPRLSACLTVQSQEADNGSEKPHSRLALILLQIFVLRFSILGISKVQYTSENDLSKRPVSTDTKTLENFKSSFLRNLSSIMKTASWAIPVKQNRLAFESLLESLFNAKEDLRTAVEDTFSATDVRIVVHDHGIPFKNDSMIDAFVLASTDGKEETVSDEIVGTMGIGLRKAVTNLDQEGGSSQNGLILRAQVVLESTLQGALNGEEDKPLEDLTGQEPARDGDGRA
ncbi:hypothetical protein CPB83DRAFT_839469 [Crepidotus variabilis]|uniref:Uncharacterized protein n=1 Tax=Crepidotus variabilis TaxID=179855 RepID=A0A9P6JJX8_9AGAR|nr:hypothetical protein CPB83DRAFT_839469 [Crepidotus variabilis]